MIGTLNPQVKICCISTREEARLAIQYGASAIGLVSNMPSGPGIIDDEKIKSIHETIPSSVSTFLLTSETKANRIIEQSKRFNTDTIQLVNELKNDQLEYLKNQLDNVNLIQVIHVQNENSIKEAIEKSRIVDAILLDSGKPNAKIKTLGGTGDTHDWNISKTIRQEINKPMWLAGGLNSENVEEAINLVQPFGVDLCSGVRTNQKLDIEKLKRFFLSVKKARIV